MKKVLLGSTALIAAAVIGVPAMAQSAAPGKQPQPLRLGLGGYFQAYGVYASQPDGVGEYGNGRREFDIKREAEVWFTGSVKLDNGLTVGAQIELEAEVCADQIDESYLYFEGGWGKLVLGSENSAGYLLSVGPPSVDGNFDGLDPNYRIINGLGGSGNLASEAWLVNLSGDAEKITYFSPKFAGFQVGVSWAPDTKEEGPNTGGFTNGKGGSFGGMSSSRQTGSSAGAWEDVVAVGVNYTNRFGPVSFAISGSYERGELSGCGALACPANLDDRQTWGAYAKVGFAGFELGGGYWEDDNGLKGHNKSSAYGGGLTYGVGPFVVGASYLNAEREQVGKDDKMQRVLVGGRYTYGPGMDLRASVQWYGLDSQKKAGDGDSWAFVLGTTVSF